MLMANGEIDNEIFVTILRIRKNNKDEQNLIVSIKK